MVCVSEPPRGVRRSRLPVAPRLKRCVAPGTTAHKLLMGSQQTAILTLLLCLLIAPDGVVIAGGLALQAVLLHCDQKGESASESQFRQPVPPRAVGGVRLL